MRSPRSVAERVGGGMFALSGVRLLAALFVVVWERSRCARSEARTNDLDADERRAMIDATSSISAVVGAGVYVFRLSPNEHCRLTLAPVHSSAIIDALRDVTTVRDRGDAIVRVRREADARREARCCDRGAVIATPRSRVRARIRRRACVPTRRG